MVIMSFFGSSKNKLSFKTKPMFFIFLFEFYDARLLPKQKNPLACCWFGLFFWNEWINFSFWSKKMSPFCFIHVFFQLFIITTLLLSNTNTDRQHWMKCKWKKNIGYSKMMKKRIFLFLIININYGLFSVLLLLLLLLFHGIFRLKSDFGQKKNSNKFFHFEFWMFQFYTFAIYTRTQVFGNKVVSINQKEKLFV